MAGFELASFCVFVVMAPKGKQEPKQKAKRPTKAEKEAAEQVAETAGEEAPMDAAALRIQQTLFVSHCSKETATPEQKASVDIYRSLPLRDPQKIAIIQNYKKDKSCTWVNSIVQKTTSTSRSEKSGFEGWTTSYDVAKRLNMQHDDQLFQIILATLPTEDHTKWSDDGVEAAFKKAELPRYHFKSTGLQKRTDVDEITDELSACSAGALSKKCKLNIVDAPAAEGLVNVVIAKPEQINMHQICKVCSTGCDKCEQVVKELKRQVAQLSARADKDQHDDRCRQIRVCLQSFESLSMEALQLLACADQIDDEDQAKSLSERLEATKGELVQMLNSLQDTVAKTKAYMNSL